MLRETMGAWLEQQARLALCAEHDEAALAIPAANRIDLLLSDVRMPVRDGSPWSQNLPHSHPHRARS